MLLVLVTLIASFAAPSFSETLTVMLFNHGSPSKEVLSQSLAQIPGVRIARRELARGSRVSAPFFLVLARGPYVPSPPTDGFTCVDQEYEIRFTRNSVVFQACDSAALLHAESDFLHRVGFRWYSDDSRFEVIPRKLDWDTLVGRTIRSHPAFSYRGFSTYERAPDDSFLLWMARNRLNLIGAVDSKKAHSYGVVNWDGGHEQIGAALSSPELFKKHPDWYGLIHGVRRPITFGDEYFNPSFGTEAMARHVAEYMEREPRYRDTDILNLWPTDSRSGADGAFCGCPACRAKGNHVDALLFTNKVVQSHLQSNLGQRAPRLAGISYYATWTPPTSSILKELGKRYLHVFYTNQRSYSQSIAQTSPEIESNAQICRLMSEWTKDHANTFGVCEYFDYSFYGGIASPMLSTLQDDIRYYRSQGLSLYSYMHPQRGDNGPRRLMNFLIARLTWDPDENVSGLVRGYFSDLFPDHAVPMEGIYREMEKAYSNEKEMFGENGLDHNLFQYVNWTERFYSPAERYQNTQKFLRGGCHDLPAKYSGRVSERSCFVGLDESLKIQEKALVELKAILASFSSPSLEKKRIQVDYEWFDLAHERYSLTKDLIVWNDLDVPRLNATEKLALEKKIRERLAFFRASPLLKRTISPVDHLSLIVAPVERLLAQSKPKPENQSVFGNYLLQIKRLVKALF